MPTPLEELQGVVIQVDTTAAVAALARLGVALAAAHRQMAVLAYQSWQQALPARDRHWLRRQGFGPMRQRIPRSS